MRFDGTVAALNRLAKITDAKRMADSELAATYRRNAANCTEIARSTENVTRKIALLDMAQAWLKLADATDKLDKAIDSN
jgi:hypothetical protein